MKSTEVVLVYDGECPVCRAYSRVVRIREAVGNFRLVDAREDCDIVREISAQGLDLDEGMVLRMGNQYYFGADAMHALSLLSTRSGLFNRINFWMFRFRSVSRALYPVLRFFRNVLLKLNGRSKLNNLKLPGNDSL